MVNRPRKMRFVVELNLPPGVSVADMRRYIEDEVKANVGQLHPDDPLFRLDRNSVEVRTAAAVAKQKAGLD